MCAWRVPFKCSMMGLSAFLSEENQVCQFKNAEGIDEEQGDVPAELIAAGGVP